MNTFLLILCTQEADEAQAAFEDYAPLKSKLGKNHPDPLVQSASLAAVAPPDVSYKLNLPKHIIYDGLLSSAQLETVIYACQNHEKFLHGGVRKGFFLGDGAGVGKGRQLAAMILESIMLGRQKHIWLSALADLKDDARRDLVSSFISYNTVL